MIGNEKNRISVVEYLQVDQIYIGCQQQKTIAENNDSRMSQNKEENEMYFNLDDILQ